MRTRNYPNRAAYDTAEMSAAALVLVGEDYSKRDVADALGSLRFDHKQPLRLIAVDRDVTELLVSALRK
jgi:hypothetical protein